MLDKLTSMAVFVCAAEKRSFAAAAEVFGISPTMVGKHVRFLEEKLGTKLLNRTTRQQSLTEVGQLYYNRCKQLLADLEEAEACADEMRIKPRGTLKVHAPTSFGVQRLVPALKIYAKDYPDVKIDLTLSDRNVDLVEEGFEVAIRIGYLADSGLVARSLKDYQMWLCASPEYLASAGTPRTPQDLAQHNCLGYAYWRKKNRWEVSKDGCAETIQINGQLTINNGQGLRAAAIAGMGVIMQPEVLVGDAVASGQLVRLLSDYDLPSRPMHIIYSPDRRPTPKLRTFIDFVVEQFG